MIDENERGIVKCDFLKGGSKDPLIRSLFPLFLVPESFLMPGVRPSFLLTFHP